MSAKEKVVGKFFAECRNGRWVVHLNDAGDAKYLCDTNTEGKAKEVVTAMNEYMAVFERNLAGIKSVDAGESILSLTATVDALRAERDEARANAGLMEMKLVACGVAAHHSDPNLTRTGVYAGKWDSQQAEDVRRLRAERDEAVSLLADARKCVVLVNTNGYYDNWLARCARVIERSAP